MMSHVKKGQNKPGLIITDFMELNPSWEADVMQLLKKSATLYGTHRFITVFTRAYFSEIHFNIIHPPMSWSF
jgi:hypothetical protein